MKNFKSKIVTFRVLITIVISILSTIMVFAQDDNVKIGLGSPAYGVKIQTNFPDYTGGWARSFNIVNRNNTENYIQFGALGSATNGIDKLSYGYIGRSYNDTYMTFKLEGRNVGIGTTNPTSKLHIKGEELGKSINDQSILTTVEGSVVNNLSKFQILNKRNSEGTEWHNTSLRLQRVVDVTPMAFIDFGIEGKTSSYGLAFGTRNGFDGTQNVRLIIEEEGNVGIGTTDTKGYKLAVAGKVIAEEVKVELQSNWPDYVFEENYDLPSLEETENFIKENGHLQNIPSAAEVAEEGISLGEMNASMLRKIEELWLHVIDLKKENDLLKVEVKTLLNK